MLTDSLPRKAELQDEFRQSDAMRSLDLPNDASILVYVRQIEEAMKLEDRAQLQRACNALAKSISTHFGAKPASVRILGVRPLEESGNRIEETYGDYTFESARIRLWMRTAVLEKVTAFGTLLSTLCHEICHHLDVVQFGFPNTYHTRGFYERAGLLYHHVRGTPVRKLVWDKLKNGKYRINWAQTMRSASTKR